ncbi:MAG: von Willebrand factor type A domain-containing protein, partial [Verrucomicrobiae bacterium]|nr:von Willebrand factor type A domain-containing protein [Verrucomicrobiae bacterium]
MNNSEEKRDTREKLEERLIALLLGEVDDKERAELERLMRENPEIARFYREMEQTADLIRKACVVSSKEVNSQEEKVPQGLSIERRRKLLEFFKKPPVSNKKVKYEWYQIRGKFLINFACAAILTLVCLISGLLLPAMSKAKAKAGRVSYLDFKSHVELKRQLRETEGDKKQQAEMAQAEGLEQAPQTAGGVLSQTFYRQEDFKKPASQAVDSLAVAQPAGVAGKPVSGDVAGGSSFAGGIGGGRAAVSESLSKNVETLGRRARYASEPPGGSPPANIPAITPPPAQPMRPSTATALKSERLMETPATPAAAFDKAPVLGDKPSLGVEFSRPAGDETATRGTTTYGNAISEVGEKRAYYFAYTPAKNALDDASGGRVEPDKGDELAWKDEVAKELYFEDSKQVVNGTISSSKIEKEALNLPKGTLTDLSAVVMSKQKSDARIPGDNAMAKKSAEIEQKVERRLFATNVLARKDTEGAELRDLPAEKKPASSPKPIQPEILTADNHFSTFSLNVSDVSFKTAAASLQNKILPEPMSIREEEFINAFNYNDPAPPSGAKIGFYWERARFPFAHNRDIVRFSVQTASAGRSLNRPMNLVILLDNSGSMERPDRIAIISEAMK